MRPKTRLERLKYMREYTKEYQNAKGGKSSETNVDTNATIPLDGSRPICSTFACGRTLSLVESLAGGKCTGCMNKHGVDPINVVRR